MASLIARDGLKKLDLLSDEKHEYYRLVYSVVSWHFNYAELSDLECAHMSRGFTLMAWFRGMLYSAGARDPVSGRNKLSPPGIIVYWMQMPWYVTTCSPIL